MATTEQIIGAFPEKYGRTWFSESLKKLIEEDRVKITGTDNAVVIEVDGEAWSVPEAYRLASFRPDPV